MLKFGRRVIVSERLTMPWLLILFPSKLSMVRGLMCTMAELRATAPTSVM